MIQKQNILDSLHVPHLYNTPEPTVIEQWTDNDDWLDLFVKEVRSNTSTMIPQLLRGLSTPRTRVPGTMVKRFQIAIPASTRALLMRDSAVAAFNQVEALFMHMHVPRNMAHNLVLDTSICQFQTPNGPAYGLCHGEGEALGLHIVSEAQGRPIQSLLSVHLRPDDTLESLVGHANLDYGIARIELREEGDNLTAAMEYPNRKDQTYTWHFTGEVGTFTYCDSCTTATINEAGQVTCNVSTTADHGVSSLGMGNSLITHDNIWGTFLDTSKPNIRVRAQWMHAGEAVGVPVVMEIFNGTPPVATTPSTFDPESFIPRALLLSAKAEGRFSYDSSLTGGQFDANYYWRASGTKTMFRLIKEDGSIRNTVDRRNTPHYGIVMFMRTIGNIAQAPMSAPANQMVLAGITSIIIKLARTKTADTIMKTFCNLERTWGLVGNLLYMNVVVAFKNKGTTKKTNEGLTFDDAVEALGRLGGKLRHVPHTMYTNRSMPGYYMRNRGGGVSWRFRHVEHPPTREILGTGMALASDHGNTEWFFHFSRYFPVSAEDSWYTDAGNRGRVFGSQKDFLTWIQDEVDKQSMLYSGNTREVIYEF